MHFILNLEKFLLNFSKFNILSIKVHLLVSEQYIDSIMHGATIKVIFF